MKFSFRRAVSVFSSEETARKLFTINAMESLLLSIGAILGSYISGSVEVSHYIGAVLGGSLAVGLFGSFAGTLLAERSERLRELRELEKLVLRELKGTIYEKAARLAPLYVAMWALVGTVAPPLAVIVPLALSEPLALSLKCSIALGLLIANALAFAIGARAERRGRREALKSGLAALALSASATAILGIAAALRS
ncbi:MAG: hypothetical protein QXU52_02195 [Fervidicoccaceae archaeon]